MKFKKKFKYKKQNINQSNKKYITFSNLKKLYQIYKKLKNNSIKSKITKYKLKKKINIIKKNKFQFKTNFLKNLIYKKTIYNLINHLKKLFLNITISKIKIILLIKKFSKYPILYNKIKNTFPKKIIINPTKTNLTILKNTIIFKHKPTTITKKKNPKYYNITTNTPFKTKIHPKSYKLKINNINIYTNIFKYIIKKNTPLTKIQKTFTLSSTYNTSNNIKIYKSNKLKTFTTKYQILKTIILNIKNYKFQNKKQKINISLKFKSTKLYIFTTNKNTNHTITNKFNYLNK